jgi:1-phosphofructokinase family hexose kinase
MILCVTLNPCLDKTLVVPAWRPGELVRGRVVLEVVGGKGNNVARALSRLRRRPRPATFLGGAVGAHCESLLQKQDGLEPLAVQTEAPTRVILTVRTESSPVQTAFFDPDPAITPAEADALVALVESALRSDNIQALTLSGSSPCATTHGIFSDLVSLARARNVPVILDTYGPALKAIWGIWPTVMQLNRREAAAHLKKAVVSELDVSALLKDWDRHGVECGIVTDGPKPVSILLRGQRYQATPPSIEPVNPIGSGDSLLAGLVDGWLSGLEPEPLFRHAIACAVANALVWDAGAIDPATVAHLREKVQIEPLPGST